MYVKGVSISGVIRLFSGGQFRHMKEGSSIVFKGGGELFCPHALEKDLKEFERQGSSYKIHLNNCMRIEELTPCSIFLGGTIE